MPRGGKREGAGRKRRLTTMQRLRIGARCERLWREAYSANTEAMLARQFHETRRQWRKAQDIPVPERPAWTASDDFEDYQDDVRGALQKDQGILRFKSDAVDDKGEPVLEDDDREPARIVRIEPTRPKVRPRIIAEVARETGETERMVERCWKLFRKVEQSD